MKHALLTTLVILAGMLLLGLAATQDEAPAPAPPAAPDVPAPPPEPEPRKPCPPNRPCPRGDAGAVSLGGVVAPDGKAQVQCDLLPRDRRIKNIGSKADGAGMCVMSSIEMGAEWAGLRQMRGLRDWCAKQPGGAYPGKVDRQIAAFCAERRIEVPPYLQYEGRDAAVVEAVLKSGRYACVTYAGSDGVRYRGPIAHMVCCVADRPGGADWVCLLDNNAVGDDELLWMTTADFARRWAGSGGGWLFVWLAPGAPPVPSLD